MWKCAMMVYGVQCAIEDGMLMMHKSFADNLDIQQEVELVRSI